MGVLVTGATGLLGANLVRELVAQGIKPRVLVRETSDHRGLRGLPVEEVTGDVQNPGSLARALESVQEVYHLAGVVRFDRASAPLLHAVHVDGTRNLLAAANAAGVRRLVHVSSVAAIGHGTLDQPATENTPFNFPHDQPYHESKRAGEQVALSDAGKVEVVVANPSLIFGPYDVKPSSGALLLFVASGLCHFYPKGGNSFVGAEDVSRGLIQLMAKGRPQERYILAGENLTYRQLLTQAAEEAGVRPPLLPVPENVLRWVGAAGEALNRVAPTLLGGVTRSMAESALQPSYYTSQKAMREVGYRPRPIRYALRKAYRWFQDEGKLRRDRPLMPVPTSP